MALALYQNLHLMWLSGMSYPDHNTINRFRSQRLNGVLKEIFSQVVFLLKENGHITLKEAYLDGTKIEAIANRYTFVWGRSIKKKQSKNTKTTPYRIENLHYDEKNDNYTCPKGQQMGFMKEKTKITNNGFRQIKRFYQA
jgi:hypothetical protein